MTTHDRIEIGRILPPDDLWFRAKEGKKEPDHYLGHRLYLLKFPKHPLENAFLQGNPHATYSPFELYCMYKATKAMDRSEGKRLESINPLDGKVFLPVELQKEKLR